MQDRLIELIQKAGRYWPDLAQDRIAGKIPTHVYLGMSGGVDSSVSAYLLQQAGFTVTGVFIKTWQPSDIVCTWKDDRRDAMRVAAKLGIQCLTIDLSEEYEEHVANYLISEYASGRTPNPDIMCNKYVKFGGFYQYALKQGADFIATGHYACTSNHGSESLLLRSPNEDKDQTYFLYAIEHNILEKVLFPVGGLSKAEVREIALLAGLHVAEKKDSQGVCFIGDFDIKEFLAQRLDIKDGDVMNLQGEVIGTHKGAILYTIGERHGFFVKNISTQSTPQFVLSKDINANTITVGPLESMLESQSAQDFYLRDVNFLSKKYAPTASGEKSQKKRYKARIRHRQSLQDVEIAPSALDSSVLGLSIHFKDPQQGVANGQSCVLYDGDICIGGGIITTYDSKER